MRRHMEVFIIQHLAYNKYRTSYFGKDVRHTWVCIFLLILCCFFH